MTFKTVYYSARVKHALSSVAPSVVAPNATKQTSTRTRTIYAPIRTSSTVWPTVSWLVRPTALP